MINDSKTKQARSNRIAERFVQALRNLQNDFEEDIVVISLMEYYELCRKPDKVDNTVDEYIEPDKDLLWAIERVLEDYMTYEDYNAWILTVKDKENTDGQ